VTIPDSTVAIIGTGNIGGTLAANFAAGGQDFLLAGRDLGAARKLADTLDGHAEAVTVDEAVARANVLVLAVWLDSSRQLIAQYGERLAGKVIVDPSNPVGPDGEGGYHKVIGEQESSGQILAGLLPAGARLVKAFGTLSAPTLAAATRQEPERAVQFYAADDAAAGDLVADLIRADGYEPVRVGPGPVHPHRDVRRPARIRCLGRVVTNRKRSQRSDVVTRWACRCREPDGARRRTPRGC
jgi:predicted dinucleotide-binding enzyme